jgi:hypothetical protein
MLAVHSILNYPELKQRIQSSCNRCQWFFVNEYLTRILDKKGPIVSLNVFFQTFFLLLFENRKKTKVFEIDKNLDNGFKLKKNLIPIFILCKNE